MEPLQGEYVSLRRRVKAELTHAQDTFVGELDVPHRRAFFVREVKTDQWMCFEAPEVRVLSSCSLTALVTSLISAD